MSEKRILITEVSGNCRFLREVGNYCSANGWKKITNNQCKSCNKAKIVSANKDKDFWKKARWVSYTTKYNERFISYMGPGTGPWNIPVVNLTPGDQLAEDSSLVEWQQTQPFFEDFMKRVCLCLNFCKDKTNAELAEENNEN